MPLLKAPLEPRIDNAREGIRHLTRIRTSFLAHVGISPLKATACFKPPRSMLFWPISYPYVASIPLRPLPARCGHSCSYSDSPTSSRWLPARWRYRKQILRDVVGRVLIGVDSASSRTHPPHAGAALKSNNSTLLLAFASERAA